MRPLWCAGFLVTFIPCPPSCFLGLVCSRSGIFSSSVLWKDVWREKLWPLACQKMYFTVSEQILKWPHFHFWLSWCLSNSLSQVCFLVCFVTIWLFGWVWNPRHEIFFLRSFESMNVFVIFSFLVLLLRNLKSFWFLILSVWPFSFSLETWRIFS